MRRENPGYSDPGVCTGFYFTGCKSFAETNEIDATENRKAQIAYVHAALIFDQPSAKCPAPRHTLELIYISRSRIKCTSASSNIYPAANDDGHSYTCIPLLVVNITNCHFAAQLNEKGK
jgi:hypothetical protein